LRDVLKFPSVDAGHGWLIFALPLTEGAFHPFWFWVAQRFSAAMKPLFLSPVLAAELTGSTFAAAC